MIGSGKLASCRANEQFQVRDSGSGKDVGFFFSFFSFFFFLSKWVILEFTKDFSFWGIIFADLEFVEIFVDVCIILDGVWAMNGLDICW